MLVRVLLLHDRPIPPSLLDAFPTDGVLTESCSFEDFWKDPAKRLFDLAFLFAEDLPNPTPETLAKIRNLSSAPEVAIFESGIADKERLAFLAAGSFALVPHGLEKSRLAKTLDQLIERRREALETAIRANQVPQPAGVEEFVSQSPATQNVLRIAKRVAQSDTSLLVLGETGAGKEWLARAVHAESPRASGPFIAINCGAMPEGLLESELFGHEKGAFTGASRSRRGYFEQAHGGTLFLDEIGEMPSHLQVRLLRVLQERRIQRLGSEDSVEVDTRIVAATHRDLKAAIDSGDFRQDLYYRLAVVTLTVPALRERVEDIPELIATYLRKFSRKLARSDITGISEEALTAMKAYAWPGNVRELINVIERAVLLSDQHEIGLVDLPMEVALPAGVEVLKAAENLPLEDLADWIDQPMEVGRLAVITNFEHQYLTTLLRRFQGNISSTARHAGVDPRTLYNKMRQLGLRKEEFK